MNCKVKYRFEDISEDRLEMPRDISALLPDILVSALLSIRPRSSVLSLLISGPACGTTAYILSGCDSLDASGTAFVSPDSAEREDAMVKKTQFGVSASVVGSTSEITGSPSRVCIRVPSRHGQVTSQLLRALSGKLPASVKEVIAVLAVAPHWRLTIPDGFDRAKHLKRLVRSDRDRQLKYVFVDAGIPEERIEVIDYPATWPTKGRRGAD